MQGLCNKVLSSLQIVARPRAVLGGGPALEAPGPAESQPQPVAAVEAQHDGWAGEFERGDTFVARAAAHCAERSIVSAWDEE
jgi:hypothetical protein